MPLYRLGDRAPQTPAPDHYWVAPDANVIGSVTIGEDVGIWFGATLRGDNEPITVGRGTNIQEGVMVHSDPGFPATIGEGCTMATTPSFMAAPLAITRWSVWVPQC